MKIIIYNYIIMSRIRTDLKYHTAPKHNYAIIRGEQKKEEKKQANLKREFLKDETAQKILNLKKEYDEEESKEKKFELSKIGKKYEDELKHLNEGKYLLDKNINNIIKNVIDKAEQIPNITPSKLSDIVVDEIKNEEKKVITPQEKRQKTIEAKRKYGKHSISGYKKNGGLFDLIKMNKDSKDIANKLIKEAEEHPELFNFIKNKIFKGKSIKIDEPNNQRVKFKKDGGSFFTDAYNKAKGAYETFTELPARAYDAIFGEVRNDRWPPHFRKALKEYGDKYITKLEVCRMPVKGYVKLITNIVTLGALSSQNYYDDFFHLYLIVYLDDGNVLYLEKNHVPTIKKWHADKCGITIDVPQQITLNDFINNAVNEVGDSIYVYDPIDNNCQVFQKNLLESNNLLTPELRDYIYQDVVEVFKNTPKISKNILKKIIDLAARGNILIEGRAIKRHKRKHKRKSK